MSASTTAPEAAALDIEDLVVALGRTHPATILHGVSLTVEPGTIVGLIGETGSGKTTLARAVLGLAPHSTGRIAAGGVQIGGLRGRALRDHRRSGVVQYVFQDPLRSLDPDHEVGRSVAEGIVQQHRKSTSERERAVAEALALVGLDPALAARRPGELSGGQRQRVAIARAMAVHPRLLICDEPVSALDAASRIHILELLVALASERGVGILLITHDLGSLAGVADRVAVLYRGRIVEEGTVADTLLRPRHPYTRLLTASVPTITGTPIPAAERTALRAEVARAAAVDADARRI